MRETALNTKTIKLLKEEPTVHLLTITPCYLLMPLINIGPVARMLAISVANVVDLMSEATAQCMGKSDKCKGPNHFRAVCHSKVTAAKTAPSPYKKKPQHQAQRTSTSSNGKGGGKQFFKKKTPKKHPPKQKKYEVTFKQPKMVLSGATPGGESSNVSNPVLSGKVPEAEGMYNRFSCFAVNSKLAHSTNTKSKPTEGLYTDTDPDNRSEIITDVTIRVPGKAGTMMMEVKVDPGAQPSCIPLHKFKTLFPHLCRDGLPRQGLLDSTQSKFQSYNGADMTCYRYLLIDVKDKVTKKYHPIRFYVMITDVPRIFISHAASYRLGLVKVLCDNKVPWIKRQVASIDKKSDFRVKSGPFRTSTQSLGSSSQKKQMSSKTVTSGKVPVPNPRMHNFEDAKIQGKSRSSRLKSGGGVDVNDKEQHSQEEISATTGKEPKTSKTGNSVLSGPNKNITDSTKDGPLRKVTATGSNAKLVPKKNIQANKHQVGSTTDHLMILRLFRSTTKVTSSVTKTPTLYTGPMTRANCQAAEKLQSTMNQVQYHAQQLKTSRNYIPIPLAGLAA